MKDSSIGRCISDMLAGVSLSGLRGFRALRGGALMGSYIEPTEASGSPWVIVLALSGIGILRSTLVQDVASLAQAGRGCHPLVQHCQLALTGRYQTRLRDT